MIRADLVLTDLSEVVTLRDGPVPRVGTAAGELTRVPNGAVAVAEGRFVWVGPERSLRRDVRLRPGGRSVEGAGGTLVPGLVDAHSHVLFAGDRAFELPLKAAGRSYPEIARLGGGILSTVRATRSARRSTLLDTATDRLQGLAGSGATTIEVKSGYALTVPGELELLRLVPELQHRSGLRLVPTFLGAHAVPPEAHGDAAGYVRRLIRDALPVVARERLASFVDVFCEPGYFPVRVAERLLRAALRLGLGVKVHADEFVRSGGALLAARLRATSADHLLCSTPRDYAALAAAGVTAVVLPVTAVALSPARRAPARELLDAGVPVALGSDCSPNTWNTSMALVLALAVHGGRLSPAEALTAATVNAAHASGLPDAGTIDLGRPADMALFPVPSVDQLGYRFDVIPTCVYRQGNLVSSRGIRQ
jgi:imidazolonepropionase